MDTKAISQRWYEKGKKEKDIFDKFIYLWISFNALYGVTKVQGERNQFKNYIKLHYTSQFDELLLTDDFKFFKSTAIKDCRVGRSGNTQRQIRKMEGNADSINKIVALMNCVYQARCNLFHGDKMPEHYNDRDIVCHAGNVLEQLLDYIYK